MTNTLNLDPDPHPRLCLQFSNKKLKIPNFRERKSNNFLEENTGMYFLVNLVSEL